MRLVSFDAQLIENRPNYQIGPLVFSLCFGSWSLTVMSLTVMKVKTPKVRLGNINVQELNSVPATPSFDTRFTTQITVKNTNFGPFKYDAAIVTFLYHGATLGQVSIPKSKAGMRSTKKAGMHLICHQRRSNVCNASDQICEINISSLKTYTSTNHKKNMAEKNQQAYPLAPTNGYTRSDAESLESVDELKRKKRIKLAIYIGIFVLFQIMVITAMSLTVMKVKTPKVRLGNINVQELNSVPASPSFDTKFTTQIRVKNTNFGPYKFDAAIVTFLYQGATVGQVSIPKSKAGMLSTKKIDVEVNLSSSALSSSNLGSELSSGVLTLNSTAKLAGKVELMFIMKKKKSSTMDCTIAFDLSSKTLKSLQCK
ncbi:hypothetical protein DVH24_008146 [Malus domestica]|uniref:Uncharacterized protein n=1 Tax=Malus domestica TaxID=3750 RepID=A0A498JKR2_MALDO|nr:hypothetical protein DVH24_008146 [Malus domestica]